ncbi:hypothetical protein DRB06_06085 [Actinomyces sp. Z5]|nr:hypothetical protein DRB06_06085 [Actinomyces sp. Z5]
MRAGGIAGYRKRRRVRTTAPGPGGVEVPRSDGAGFHSGCAQPQVRRGHSPTAWEVPPPICRWLAGATCTWPPSSTAYGRRLVGWAVRDHMHTSLVVDALRAAAHTRGSLQGAIFHSDHGSVYTPKDFHKACKDLGVTQSMGAVGTSANQRPGRVLQRRVQTGSAHGPTRLA